MKIGIDISQIIYEGTGVARFTKGLVEIILELDNKNEWTFFFSSKHELQHDIKDRIFKKKFKLLTWKFPPTLLSIIWNDLHIMSPDRALGKLDWFITSDWTEPPSKIRKTTIVHDLVFRRFPETVDEKILKTQTKRLKWVKKESSLIFTDSESTKKDLIHFENINEEKVKVLHPGVTIKKPNKNQIKTALNKFHLKKSFILTVGKIEPRKNIEKLIDAYTRLKRNDIDLVIVGPEGWGDNQLKTNANIHYLGFVSDIDLYSLMSSCLIFTYPSIWEGFGYPVIEAMSLETAVCASNTSSIAEIVGDGASLFDPYKTDEISKTLNMLINDQGIRLKLISRGKQISKQYQWRNYYNQLIKYLISL